MSKTTAKSMQTLWDSGVFLGENAGYLEEMLEKYLAEPEQVDQSWRKLFTGLGVSNSDLDKDKIVELILQAINNPYKNSNHVTSTSADPNTIQKHIRVAELINAYRRHGHTKAKLDPLELVSFNSSEQLELREHNLSDHDLKNEFALLDYPQTNKSSLKRLIEDLEKIYCGTVGVEYMHLDTEQELTWFKNKLEKEQVLQQQLTKDEQEIILERLTAAEGLEKFLGAKYPGAKRFSAEGAESMIVALDKILQSAASNGVKEIAMGMPHRGRLNVLVNTLGKKPGELFAEFEGKNEITLSMGDVKYHQGISADLSIDSNNLHVSMAYNPSHLEIVNPVITGSVRARQTKYADTNKNLVMPLLLHGDSAVAGQGVVMETLNLSQTRGYGVGGTLHMIVNNQVGFTTNKEGDTRSTRYCSDVAKGILVPVLHVNADSPESVYKVAKLAVEYRMQFKKDIFIDLVCYRKHGHNEADEPSATQPKMYQVIKKLASTRKKYADQLLAKGVLTQQQVNALVTENRKNLEQIKLVARNIIATQPRLFDWSVYKSQRVSNQNTSYEQAKLTALYKQIASDAAKVSTHSRVSKILSSREKMAAGEVLLDWGFAENMAYATLLEAGYSIRISGQDCGRGTFFHRHAVLHDQETGEEKIPLANVAIDAKLEIIDSVLSEEAVLGFEYGYATTDPKTLVIWEAQFGDFVNGAQVVIDQFISSAEHKWGRYCGLVMLLPHGYEGMGPEHSSARLERFLQLCAQDNMQVCVPSTPAQNYHLLRRQMLSDARKPLIVMSPKSLLRHKEAVSSLEDLSAGEFVAVIKDNVSIANKITRVVLCSGKVYYELLEQRDKHKLQHIALLRVEQLYPFPSEELSKFLAEYTKASEVIWCQEEPKNQGAWYCIKHEIEGCLTAKQNLSYAGRLEAAAPAVGYASLHNKEQEQLIKQALDLS